MNRFPLLVCVIAVASSGILADSDGMSYAEHKTAGHVVRISRGPGEPYSVGSYAIRVYGANGLDLVAGVIRPRDGEVVRSWVTDLAGEKHLWIWIWTRVAGSGAYGTLKLLDFDGKALRQLPLAAAQDSLLKGYRGHDLFDVVDGKVYRQFPLYGPNDSNANPTGGTRCLELDLKQRKWSLSKHRIEDS